VSQPPQHLLTPQRTNPTDIPSTSFVPPATDKTKKKQSANVRRILTGRKGLKDWLDELVRQSRFGLIPSAVSSDPAVSARDGGYTA
jgi:hypothetical protein